MEDKPMSAHRNPANPGFSRHHYLEQLAAEQGVKPVTDIAAIREEFSYLWSDDEIDAFLAFLEEGREPDHPCSYLEDKTEKSSENT
jgi:hypothetical protein